MSLKGLPKSLAPSVITLACGHAVVYSAPVPNEGDELICGVCFRETHVTASPRRWRTR